MRKYLRVAEYQNNFIHLWIVG